MKTLTTLAALLIAGASVYANVGEKNSVNPKKTVAIAQNVEAKYKLVYLKQTKGTVKINIFNENGDRVHNQEVVNDNGFAQQFDFSSLPFGTYTFEVIHPDGSRVIETVDHAKVAPVINRHSLKANIININDGKRFRLAVLAPGNKPVNIKIYDDKNRLIYQESVKEDDGFRKIYDLEKMDSSSFKFEVSSNKEMVTVSSE